MIHTMMVIGILHTSVIQNAQLGISYINYSYCNHCAHGSNKEGEAGNRPGPQIFKSVKIVMRKKAYIH